jgi:hypothetical protein
MESTMDAIPDENAATVLAKCGRRCCICRRFKPLRLQVHHIDEKAKGGSNEVENLIALCLTCHAEVHSDVPFTRRFTRIELKMHRDNLYKLVAEGKLPQGEEEMPLRESTNHAIEIEGTPNLMREAVNLLVELAQGDGFILDPTSCECSDTVYDREYAKHRAAFKQLCNLELLEFSGGTMYVLTDEGFTVADAFITLINEKPAEKAAEEAEHDGEHR